MTTYHKFDRETARKFRDELQAVLDAFGDAKALNLKLGNIRFHGTELSVKVSVAVKGATTRADNELSYMMKLNNLGFTGSDGETLIRYDAKKRKYPFIYEKGGRSYKTSEIGASRIFRVAT